jgi:hypothetical protein
MATGDYIAKFNPRSIRKRQPFMYRDLVPGGGAKSKAAQAAAIGAGVPAAREVALANLGSGAEAAYPIQPDVYGGQDTDASSPGPTQITDPNAPQNIPSQRESTPMMGMEQQEAIANQGRGARYDADSIMGLVSSLAGTPKANEAFDSTKPIGGENVPYKPAGIFQRVLGNQANMLNLGAQQAQGAEWQDKALRDEERQAKREDLAYEINLRTDAEKDLKEDDRTFTASQAEAARQFQSAQNALDRALRLAEGTANREAAITEARARLTAARENLDRELTFRGQEGERERTFRGKEGRAERKLRREAIKPANFTRLGDNVFVDREGNVMEYTPGTPAYGKQKGTRGRLRRLGMPGSAPMPEEGDVDVDPTTGKPLGSTQISPATTQPPTITPTRVGVPSFAPSPVADQSTIEQFRQMMPGLNLEAPRRPGVTSPFLTEGELGEQVMSQIAYPLRAAAAQEAKGEFENPEFAASVLERRPFGRLRRPSATEMSQARQAGELIRKMYAE